MKVVTFGEIMLRLAPFGNLRFFQESALEATFGGGEANVAVSLSFFGYDAAFVTKVPDNAIGQAAISELRKHGVNTTYIAKGGDRLGIYYLEKGMSVRASNVIYDRVNSSISKASEKDFNWHQIFDNVNWFHFTGITPALSDDLANILILALKIAKEKGIKVSCDLNYRKKLWSTEKAKKVMSKLMQYVDVLIANEEDAEKVFGIKAKNADISKGKIERESFVDVAKQLVEKFNFEAVAISLRESISASLNNWGGMLYVKDKAYFSKTHNINILDRVGGGDSFCAGLIYGLNEFKDYQEVIEFAAAASALKQTIEGDFNLTTVDEVKTLIKTDGSGRIQR